MRLLCRVLVWQAFLGISMLHVERAYAQNLGFISVTAPATIIQAKRYLVAHKVRAYVLHCALL